MAVAMDAMAVAIHIKYALNQNCPILYTAAACVQRAGWGHIVSPRAQLVYIYFVMYTPYNFHNK